MQLKTIRKNIQTKMEEWLKTITDEELRKKVKKNILVSGGSITSMLLKEPVNDYDVYLMDHDVLLDLCGYYTKPFSDIKILDGKRKKELIEIYGGQEKLDETINDSGDKIKNDAAYPVALRNLKENQIKLYFESKDGGKRVNEDKESETEKGLYFPKFFSPNSISLSDKVQIVCRFHGNADEVHKTFDFIHATNYFTFEDGLVTNKAALISILTKQLKYQGSLYPLTTIIRIKKFLKRGWNITAGEQLKVMFQIGEHNLTDPDVLEEQLIGVDVAYFSTLIEILRGVPVEKRTTEYLNTIIDRVFDGADEINDEL